MTKPIAVVIGDIHFTLNTLDLASAALKQAVAKAKELEVPLIINGDTLDTKAVMRAECVNAFLACLDYTVITYVNVGNHDMINEKAEGEHALNFLNGWDNVVLVDYAWPISHEVMIVPYSSPEILKSVLVTYAKAAILVVHQGLYGADMGHYTTDKTSLKPEDFAGRRVIASHYHKRQDIDLPGGGLWSYIGNPYTLSFGEANDPSKGFAVLFEDGSLEHVDTNLRRHITFDLNIADDPWGGNGVITEDDLVRIRIRGPASELDRINKAGVLSCLDIPQGTSVRFDLIPDAAQPIGEEQLTPSDTPADVLDTLIDALPDSGEHKEKLKALWRTIHEG